MGGGNLPDEHEYPVGGVSWFEAAAYAEFAGKELPTFHHWFKAFGPERVNLFADIAQYSNFEGKGPVAVGALGGISPFGTFDMAGNVREWCWTESRGQRYLLGGGWTDSAMQYCGRRHPVAVGPSPRPGFRCARYMALLPPELGRPSNPGGTNPPRSPPRTKRFVSIGPSMPMNVAR
jgi:hypothetical protein